MSLDLDAVQAALSAEALDGWLLYDFRRSNPIAHRVLGIDPHQFFSRRWFYYIPAHGEPVALISAVEPHVLREQPGHRKIFQAWGELHEFLRETLAGAQRIAMEYSPQNAIPVCSWVDAGTVELIRSLGPEVVSSANIAQRFEAVLSPERIASHRVASKRILAAKDRLLDWLREQFAASEPDLTANLTEFTVQEQFVAFMREGDLLLPHGPIVAVNAHAGDPHYETKEEGAAQVRRGDLLLLDFDARMNGSDDSVIADYTWMAQIGERVPDRAAQLFAIVRQARDAGLDFIRQRAEARQPVRGFEVDDVVRAVVSEAGYGQNFVHRSGHNIGTQTHGSGANLDNLETHDDRLLLPFTCCSMEPGIYLPDIGVRSEVNVLMLDGAIEVTGVPAQTAILPLLA